MRLNDELSLDRRQCARMSVNSTIRVRLVGGVSHQVKLHDVSAAGCRVELVESAELGEPIITRFPQLELLVGKVRWKGVACAGLELSPRMHPAVFDALVSRLH